MPLPLRLAGARTDRAAFPLSPRVHSQATPEARHTPAVLHQRCTRMHVAAAGLDAPLTRSAAPRHLPLVREPQRVGRRRFSGASPAAFARPIDRQRRGGRHSRAASCPQSCARSAADHGPHVPTRTVRPLTSRCGAAGDQGCQGIPVGGRLLTITGAFCSIHSFSARGRVAGREIGPSSPCFARMAGAAAGKMARHRGLCLRANRATTASKARFRG